MYVSSLGEETASGWVMGKLSDSSSSSHKSQESFELKVCQKCYCYETCNVLNTTYCTTVVDGNLLWLIQTIIALILSTNQHHHSIMPAKVT